MRLRSYSCPWKQNSIKKCKATKASPLESAKKTGLFLVVLCLFEVILPYLKAVWQSLCGCVPYSGSLCIFCDRCASSLWVSKYLFAVIFRLSVVVETDGGSCPGARELKGPLCPVDSFSNRTATNQYVLMYLSICNRVSVSA